MPLVVNHKEIDQYVEKLSKHIIVWYEEENPFTKGEKGWMEKLSEFLSKK